MHTSVCVCVGNPENLQITGLVNYSSRQNHSLGIEVHILFNEFSSGFDKVLINPMDQEDHLNSTTKFQSPLSSLSPFLNHGERKRKKQEKKKNENSKCHSLTHFTQTFFSRNKASHYFKIKNLGCKIAIFVVIIVINLVPTNQHGGTLKT